MKKIGFLALVITSLVLVGVVIAVEVSTTAAVTVNEYISFTVTPCTGGIDFGDLDPGTTDAKAGCQSGAGVSQVAAIALSADAVTNVPLDVSVKGTDFLATYLPVTKVEYDDDGALLVDPDTFTNVCNGALTKGTLSTGYVEYWSSVKNAAAAWSCGLWYWIDIPSGYIPAGDYSSTFYVQALKAA